MPKLPLPVVRKQLANYNGIWTYRYCRLGRPAEKHYGTLDAAIRQAISDIEHVKADPIHVRAGSRVVMEEDELFDEWELRFL